MEKTYNPHAIEKKWYAIWEKEGYFIPRGNNTPYCIMIPPPNVTGVLHMGHGFQQTLMDILIRFHRMSGDQTLWQVGTDHAGISTQMVVERQLQQEGKTRHDLGRQAFEKRIWQWKNESDNNITRQLRRLGTSVDWTRERFTLDEQVNRAVEEVFIRLYDEGLIYRGQRLVNWDPSFQTAISDLEVISQEEQGFLWHIRYPLADDNGYVIIATTRPETLLGDTGVAINPQDARYQHLLGKSIKLPLTDRLIPIIADEYVDMEFGTGCVKITPAHDFNDYAVGQRHNLPLINIFTPDAHLNTNAPKKYQGLERFAARAQIVKDLEQLGLLDKTEPHQLKVPRNDRGSAVIEPYLTDQWFIKTKPLAEPAISAVEKDEIKFVPESWKKTYFQWMYNIEDWCISRQLWWGHRIPAWYDDQNNIYVGRNLQEVRAKYHLAESHPLRQEEDVLDTWFSSALWPFATLGWPEQTKEMQTFYPTNVLVTGFDIIFFWVARMIMMGLKFTGIIPFNEVYIHGLIRDSEGQKMSKSKGNVLDPIDLIDGIDLESLLEKRTTGLMQPYMKERITKQTRKEFPEGIPAYGTDALRFTFAALATQGRDIRFDLNRLQGYANFCNKLWNAARYVLMNGENQDLSVETIASDLSLADRWIESRLQEVIQEVSDNINTYRFDLASQVLYEFIWHEFCDWYLELSKPVLFQESDSAENQKKKLGTLKTLVNTLTTILKLSHPFMPFITEEIWQSLKAYSKNAGPTIMLEAYPQKDANRIDKTAEQDIHWLQIVIVGIRNIRGEMKLSPSIFLPLYLNKGNEQDRARVKDYSILLKSLAKLASIEWLPENSGSPPSATALAGELELLVPIAGLIDKEAELTRLQKEIDKLTKELQRTEVKLNNQNYVAKAPVEVVNKERERATEMQIALSTLHEKIEILKKL